MPIVILIFGAIGILADLLAITEIERHYRERRARLFVALALACVAFGFVLTMYWDNERQQILDRQRLEATAQQATALCEALRTYANKYKSDVKQEKAYNGYIMKGIEDIAGAQPTNCLTARDFVSYINASEDERRIILDKLLTNVPPHEPTLQGELLPPKDSLTEPTFPPQQQPPTETPKQPSSITTPVPVRLPPLQSPPVAQQVPINPIKSPSTTNSPTLPTPTNGVLHPVVTNLPAPPSGLRVSP